MSVAAESRREQPSGHQPREKKARIQPLRLGMSEPRHAVSALIALAVIPIAACGHIQKTIGSIPPTTTTASASVGVPLDSTVGQSVTTANGNVITVYSFESPAAFADAGFVIAVADIGACAAASPPRSGATRAAVSARLFRLELADGTLQPSVAAFKQPALPDQVLAPGACARGWVSFRLPEQIRASFVVLRSLSAVRWRIS